MDTKHKSTSEGLTITELPAASAGAIFFNAIKRGWLKGCHRHQSKDPKKRNVCTHRDLCNNTKGHSLNIVQQFPLSRSDEPLLGFQEGGVVIPTLNVKGNRKNIGYNGGLQPLG